MQIVVTKLQCFHNINSVIHFRHLLSSMFRSASPLFCFFSASLISPVSVVVSHLATTASFLFVSVPCRLSVARYFKILFHDSGYHVSSVFFRFKSLLHQFIDVATLACVQLLVFANSTPLSGVSNSHSSTSINCFPFSNFLSASPENHDSLS